MFSNYFFNNIFDKTKTFVNLSIVSYSLSWTIFIKKWYDFEQIIDYFYILNIWIGICQIVPVVKMLIRPFHTVFVSFYMLSSTKSKRLILQNNNKWYNIKELIKYLKLFTAVFILNTIFFNIFSFVFFAMHQATQND